MGIPILDMKDDTFGHQFSIALEEYGFASVVGHELDPIILHGAFDEAVKVFALPEEIKKKYENPTIGRQVGYGSFGVEHAKDSNVPDLKEFWHIYNDSHPLRTPFPEEVPGASAWWPLLFSALDFIASKMLWELGNHIHPEKPGYLQNMAAGGNSLLRILHYPEVPTGTVGERSAPHEDINLITLLVAATKPGLQVKTVDGDWIPVNNPPEAIVVNAADMLQMNTFGRFKSATHRVVNPDVPDGSRYSMPFFVHPRSECALVTAGDYLKMRLREIGVL